MLFLYVQILNLFTRLTKEGCRMEQMKIQPEGLGSGLVVEGVPHMHKALGLIPSTA